MPTSKSAQDEKIIDLMNAATDERNESAADVSRRLAALVLRVDGVERGVRENTTITANNAADTRELLDMFRAAKGGLTVMSWLGRLAKWVAGFVAAFVAIYAFIQNMRGH